MDESTDAPSPVSERRKPWDLHPALSEERLRLCGRVLDESHHFVFLIDQVPVRFYRGPAEGPTARTLRQHANEATQLSLALGEEAAGGLVFRFAVETTATGGVERVVFLALRGEDRTECFWPIPLEVPSVTAQGGAPVQLRLITDDGYAGPGKPDPIDGVSHGPTSRRTRRGPRPGL